ncbi:MAG: hypothetical protein M1834_003245 [Cirrosporium novae-zelandiae]|nr:MAG: hypothetical protein M1834_003245 [Cirrosporium novae-zelandiae]
MATFHRYVVEPFPSLSCDSLISMGASGIVHTVDSSIALKSPKAYTVEMDDKDPRKEIELRRAREEEKESRREITREKAFFEILDREPHPHIIQSFFFAPEGIFMHRLQCNLELRLSPERRDNPIICRKTEIQWIKGIASGAAWLEKKGFAHGDIRPGNILLDDQENVKLCDFDCMVKMKEGLIAFNTLFLKPKEEIATSQTDLFAIASTAYNIITRNPLFHPLDLWNDDDYEEIERRLAASEFPPTNDLFCGFLIRKCWTDGYKSVADLAEEAKQIYDCTSCNETDHSHVNPQVLGENEVKTGEENTEATAGAERWASALIKLSRGR